MFNQKSVKWSFLIASVLVLAACGEVGPSPSLFSSSASSSTPNSISQSSNSSSSSQPPVQYTITFKNYDDSVLSTQTVNQGSTVVYSGPTPTRPNTSQYTYTFTGWDRTLTNITSSFTTKAEFTSTTNTYTVTWQNHDGTTLETDTDVPYGTTPTYDGATPIKTGNSQYSYSFSGWTPSISSVTTNITYTAQYSESTNGYTITWQNHDGTVLETDTNVPYGTTPTYDGPTPLRTGSAQYSYTFTGWSPTIASVTGDVTYIAIFNQIEGTEGLSYTFSENQNGYFVSGYNGNSEIVYIPAYHLGKPVKVIGTYKVENFQSVVTGFFQNTRIKKVVIPDTVIGINPYAFYGCTSLEEVLMSNVTHIYSYAFGNNYMLKNIEIPSSLVYMGERVFKDCYRLESVYIGGAITSESRYLFENCISLKTLFINGGVISSDLIGANTDGSNNPPLQEVSFGESVLSIGIKIFQYCGSNIKKITFLSGFLLAGTLLGCINLTDVYFGVNCTLAQGILKDCPSIVNLTIPTLNDYLGKLFESTTTVTVSYTIPSGSYLNSMPNFEPTTYKSVKAGGNGFYNYFDLPTAWRVSNFWFTKSGRNVLLQGPYTLSYNTHYWSYTLNGVSQSASYNVPYLVTGGLYYVPMDIKIRILDTSFSPTSEYIVNSGLAITIG
jgi:hypothetical protein